MVDTADPPLDAGGSPSLTLLLRHSESLLQRRLRPSLDDLDLTWEHWRLLSVLLDRPGATMTALSGSAVLTAATTTRHVDRLVERGIVVRRVDPDDRRRVVVALSPAGRRIAAALREEEQAVERALAEALGVERFTTLSAGLRDLPALLG